MMMTLKVLQYNSRGVNKGLGVEHHAKYFGRSSLIYTCRRK